MSEAFIEKGKTTELTGHDQCDQCVSQAYVVVKGITGELFFCAHHFTKIEGDPEAYAKLEAFSYDIQDNRQDLSDKRSGI